MRKSLPSAVPEIPVADMASALGYYERCLGFNVDWGGAEGGLSGVSRGECRLFLSDAEFRGSSGASAPVVTWLNLDSQAEVDALHAEWLAAGAAITAPPASKPWKLREFTAADVDGNLFRVFYDFSRDVV